MKTLRIILAIIAILCGLFAIIKIVREPELVVGLISLTFGIMAIIWVIRARSSLSPQSSLRNYTTHFLLSLVFILLFSIWHMLNKMLLWEQKNVYLVYPEYFFITIAYIVFVISAYKILYLGKEFGFQAEAKNIARIIKEKKKRNKL